MVRRSKSGRPRLVPLGANAQAALLRYLVKARPQLHPDSNSLWAGWTRNGVQNMLRKLQGHLGFRFSAHTCRHTFATHAIRAGADLETVRKVAGWADYRMLMSYVHLQPDDLRDKKRGWSLSDQFSRRGAG